MKSKFLMIGLLLSLGTSTIMAQNENIVVRNGVRVDVSRYPDYDPVGKPDWSLMKDGNKGKLKGETVLPEYWNNADTKYFPPVFNQAGGSCGPSSRIGYMLTEELNAYRDTDASSDDNRLPPNFVYPFSYNGSSKDQLAIATGVPSVTVYGGFPYSSIYGFCESDQNYGGWMNGYEKWYAAMFNRLGSTSNFPLHTGTEEGRNAVKRWLYNHNGDESFKTGGIVGIGCGAAEIGLKAIGKTDANTAAGVVGKQYLYKWRSSVDHAMTVVGWDDRLEFDLDSNGKYGEANNGLGQNEKGAWILVNSWGGWANNGFVYVPYALGGPTSAAQTLNGKEVHKLNGGYWTPEIYKIRKDYAPKRTIKIRMTFTQRSAISIGAGISTNMNATKPDQSIAFHHFNYQGDADKEEGDAMMPMLGKWADGQLHYEPMEFGYDLSDLSDGFDQSRPLKYFLVINSKSDAVGTGAVYAASIMDYTINPDGVEIPFELNADSVVVKNAGGQTIISVVVNGESLPEPLNPYINGNKLVWEAPAGAGRKPVRYLVFESGKKLGETENTEYTIDPVAGKSFTVKAVYDIDGREVISKESSSTIVPVSGDDTVDNIVGIFENGGFTIPDIFNEQLSQATIEFRIKPSSLKNWNQQIGPNWGSFLMHTTSAGEWAFGWDTGDRGTAASGTLKNNTWTHLAVVIDGGTMYLYQNGTLKVTHKATSHSGIGGFGALEFGSHSGSSSALYAQIDEVRIWKEARTRTQLARSYNYPLLNPTQYNTLAAYYKMDTIEEDGEVKLRDCVGGHHASFIKPSANAAKVEEVTQTGFRSAPSLAAGIVKPSNVVVGQVVKFQDQSTPNAVSRTWVIEGKTYNVYAPSVVFTTPGDKEVKLTVADVDGNTAENSITVTVAADATPTAEFSLSSETIAGSDRISFLSKNTASGCTYLWKMPGAVVETATTTNASAIYTSEGRYNVKLTVTGPDGQKYNSEKWFTVTAAAPVARYNILKKYVVVGDTVHLRDNSLYTPTSARWVFESEQSIISTFGLNTVIVPTVAGVYNLNYKVGNEHGISETTGSKVLYVCNADAQNGLTFGGGNSALTASGTPAGITNAWSLMFWFNAMGSVSSKTLGMNGGEGGFTLTTKDDGSLVLSCGTDSVSSAAGFIDANGWHHYAITYSKGSVVFFRDGTSVSRGSTDVADMTDYWKGFAVGGENTPTNGCIDELAIFSKQLYQTRIRAYCVKPIDQVVNATDKPYYALYYHFNHNSGNAEDASGNNLTGIRTGFGPDGDAWSSSLGVFALNFSSSQTYTPLGSKQTRTGWQVIAWSDQESTREQCPATNAFDGSESSFWHSQYSTSTPYPHSITFKRTNDNDIEGLMLYYSRESNYRASGLRVEVSENGEDWTVADDNITLANIQRPGVTFLRPITEPYIRLVFTSGYGSYLALNEIAFYGGLVKAGVNDLFIQQNDGFTFDLQGRRVEKTQKGVYIKNGKKVLVK